VSSPLKNLSLLLAVGSVYSAIFACAACSTDAVIVKGSVENGPQDAIVRVELVFPKQANGDSGESTIENASFTIKVPYYTQSRGPLLNGNLFEKCNRKPSAVIVTLRAGDQEYDRISLDIAKDFDVPFPGSYTLRSKIVLHGPSPHPSAQAPVK
jgi:hypothetical protein